MSDIYSKVTREQLVADLKMWWEFDEKESFLQEAPREALIAKLEKFEKVGTGLWSPAIDDLVRMVAEGELDIEVWHFAQEIVGDMVGSIILAERWKHDKSGEVCRAVYKLLNYEAFGISERTVKDIAKKHTRKDIAHGLAILNLMRAMAFYVRPIRGKKRALVFTGFIKLHDWIRDGVSKSWHFRQLFDYFQRNGGRPAKLEDVAIDAYSTIIRERGEGNVSPKLLRQYLGKAMRFLKTFKLTNLDDGSTSELDPMKSFQIPYTSPFGRNSERFDRDEALSKINLTIVESYKRSISARDISQKLVAAELGYGSIKKGTGADMLRKRWRACGVTEEWGTYVDKVIAEFVSGQLDRK
jgi:hypothetical protein